MEAALVVAFAGGLILGVLDAWELERGRAAWARLYELEHRAACTADHCGLCGRP